MEYKRREAIATLSSDIVDMLCWRVSPDIKGYHYMDHSQIQHILKLAEAIGLLVQHQATQRPAGEF